MATYVPTQYADISKASNDLLGKDFPVGSTKLEVKTTAPNGVTFNVIGNQDSKTHKIAGELKTKYVDYKNGLTVTESWTTGNLLTTQIELENKVAKGLKLDVTGGFLPATGKKTAKVGVLYKQLGLHSRVYADLLNGPVLTADTVVARDGFSVGGDVSYDVKGAFISKYAAAVAYTAPEYSVAVHATNSFKVFTASYYHRINSDLEASGRATWDSKAAPAAEGKVAQAVALEVGTKYYLDKDAFVKAKVNNHGIVHIGYTQALRRGVKVTLGAQIDTASNQGKIGSSLVLEA